MTLLLLSSGHFRGCPVYCIIVVFSGSSLALKPLRWGKKEPAASLFVSL